MNLLLECLAHSKYSKNFYLIFTISVRVHRIIFILWCYFILGYFLEMCTCVSFMAFFYITKDKNSTQTCLNIENNLLDFINQAIHGHISFRCSLFRIQTVSLECSFSLYICQLCDLSVVYILMAPFSCLKNDFHHLLELPASTLKASEKE